MTEGPAILKLRIERFRGIEALEWNPGEKANVVLGGGDVGKTTILEAIGLLLSPSAVVVLSEADYWQRDVDAEFVIRAVVALSPSSGVGQQKTFAWPWEWDGTNAVLPADPDDEGAPSTSGKPVYCLQVRGTPDLQARWEVLQPNEEVDPLSVAVRRNIGVVRLTSHDRNDRDLRLVYGSALDRLLADRTLRAKIGQQVSEIDLTAKLDDTGQVALRKLDEMLAQEALPSNLGLGLTTSRGISIGALIGLMAELSRDVSLPISAWGAGTRRMTALQIAAATQSEGCISLIDEVERGLEPYRLRKLVKSLQEREAQSFITTHSPVAISAADQADLWYLDGTGSVGRLPRSRILSSQQIREPETFLARFSIIAEGPTEVGFVSNLLARAIEGSFADHGVRVCDGQGNPNTLGLLEAMARARLFFGGFADDEGEHSGRWSGLRRTMGDRLFRWRAGCTEEIVLSHVEDQNLAAMVGHTDPGVDAERRVTLAARLGIQDKSLDAIEAAAPDLRALMIAAATGSRLGAPDPEAEKLWRRHGQRWFKSADGGYELADKIFELGVWPSVKPLLMPFLNAVRDAIGQSPLSDIDHEG
ncbi:MAG: AAA family ATPase [Chloroflexi bacterium]|nr:AAA family ATPase [Chloroflexota bacterium]